MARVSMLLIDPLPGSDLYCSQATAGQCRAGALCRLLALVLSSWEVMLRWSGTHLRCRQKRRKGEWGMMQQPQAQRSSLLTQAPSQSPAKCGKALPQRRPMHGEHAGSVEGDTSGQGGMRLHTGGSAEQMSKGRRGEAVRKLDG